MWIKTTAGEYVNLERCEHLFTLATAEDNTPGTICHWVMAAFGEDQIYLADFASPVEAHTSLDNLFQTWRECSQTLFLVPDGVRWITTRKNPQAPFVKRQRAKEGATNGTRPQ